MDQNRPLSQRALVFALYLNAALLAVILLVLVGRDSGPSLLPAAYGAPLVQPIAGGGSVYLMPAQFSQNRWGCFVMDIDKQTLCAYEYFPAAEKGALRFVAARQFSHDLRQKYFNTTPDPKDMRDLSDMEKNGVRGVETGPQIEAPAESQSGDGAP